MSKPVEASSEAPLGAKNVEPIPEAAPEASSEASSEASIEAKNVEPIPEAAPEAPIGAQNVEAAPEANLEASLEASLEEASLEADAMDVALFCPLSPAPLGTDDVEVNLETLFGLETSQDDIFAELSCPKTPPRPSSKVNASLDASLDASGELDLDLSAPKDSGAMTLFASASGEASQRDFITSIVQSFQREQEARALARAREAMVFMERVQSNLDRAQRNNLLVMKRVYEEVNDTKEKVTEIQDTLGTVVVQISSLATKADVSALALVLSNSVFSALRNRPVMKTLLRFIFHYGFDTVRGRTCVVFHTFPGNVLALCISIRALSALMRFFAPSELLGWSKSEWRTASALAALLHELTPLEMGTRKEIGDYRAMNTASCAENFGARATVAVMKKEWVCIDAQALVESVHQLSSEKEEWLCNADSPVTLKTEPASFFHAAAQRKLHATPSTSSKPAIGVPYWTELLGGEANVFYSLLHPEAPRLTRSARTHYSNLYTTCSTPHRSYAAMRRSQPRDEDESDEEEEEEEAAAEEEEGAAATAAAAAAEWEDDDDAEEEEKKNTKRKRALPDTPQVSARRNRLRMSR